MPPDPAELAYRYVIAFTGHTLDLKNLYIKEFDVDWELLHDAYRMLQQRNAVYARVTWNNEAACSVLLEDGQSMSLSHHTCLHHAPMKKGGGGDDVQEGEEAAEACEAECPERVRQFGPADAILDSTREAEAEDKAIMDPALGPEEGEYTVCIDEAAVRQGDAGRKLVSWPSALSTMPSVWRVLAIMKRRWKPPVLLTAVS